MSYSKAPDFSFLQMLQQQMPSLQTLSMQWSTWDGLIDGIFQLLGQHQIRATIWTKLPPTAQSVKTIETYHRTGLVDHSYPCQQIDKAATSPVASQSHREVKAIAANVVPLVLEARSHLDHEFFVLVLSSQVSLLLLAQESSERAPDEQAPDERAQISRNHSSMQVVYNFSPVLIEALLNEIKQSLAWNDSTPEVLFANSEGLFPLPTSVDVNLLSDLLQIPWQKFKTSDLSSPSASSLEKPLSSGILLTAEFLTQLTRELSLPLTKIKTALRLLDSMQHKREQRQRYLTLLQGECDRQNSVLSALQELAELNQKGEEGDRSLNLEDLVPGIVSTYQPIATEKGINLGYKITAGLPPVACYEQWLRQILRHLLQNSLKFTLAKGRIYVQVDRKQDSLALIVTDTGVGIESKDIPHLFEPFFRGRNLPLDEIEGSGLGLMVVKQLIDRCQGTIKVNSQLHKGTRIIITLPIVDE